jgi:hypothetical protein
MSLGPLHPELGFINSPRAINLTTAYAVVRLVNGCLVSNLVYYGYSKIFFFLFFLKFGLIWPLCFFIVPMDYFWYLYSCKFVQNLPFMGHFFYYYIFMELLASF